MFFKMGVLKNFIILTRKHLYRSPFLLKLQAEACNFIKKETLAQVFPVNSAKFSRTAFFTEHLQWLLL